MGSGMSPRKEVRPFAVIQRRILTNCLLRMVPISSFYLGATPSASLSTTAFTRPQPQSRPVPPSRAPSLPTSPPPSDSRKTPTTPPRQNEDEDEGEDEDENEESSSRDRPTSLRTLDDGSLKKSRRTGTMDRAFKFPLEPPRSPIPDITINGEPAPKSPDMPPRSPDPHTTNIPDEAVKPVELPPPTPAKGEMIQPVPEEVDNEEVGETEEVDLS